MCDAFLCRVVSSMQRSLQSLLYVHRRNVSLFFVCCTGLTWSLTNGQLDCGGNRKWTEGGLGWTPMSSITKFSKTCKCFYLCSGCITARPGKVIMLQGLEKGFLLYGSSCTSQTWGLERFPYYGSSCAARPRKVYVFIGANQVQTMVPTISHHTSCRQGDHHHHHCHRN